MKASVEPVVAYRGLFYTKGPIDRNEVADIRCLVRSCVPRERYRLKALETELLRPLEKRNRKWYPPKGEDEP